MPEAMRACAKAPGARHGIALHLRRALAATLDYLWQGWGAAASVLLFFALWEWAAQYYGELLLPGPLATLAHIERMRWDATVTTALLDSARRTLYGFSAAALVGSLLGMLAGLSMTAAMAARPLITLLLGMPPIAWLVLAMLWFHSGDATPVFTVFVACLPIVFAAAMQGARTLDSQLNEVARMLRLPWWMRFTDVYLPHMLSWLFPAWITALGVAWKVVVMAELLSDSGGVGGAMSVARAQLDSVATMSWVTLVLALLLATEYLLLEPFKRHAERWRQRA